MGRPFHIKCLNNEKCNRCGEIGPKRLKRILRWITLRFDQGSRSSTIDNATTPFPKRPYHVIIYHQGGKEIERRDMGTPAVRCVRGWGCFLLVPVFTVSS